MGEEGVDQTIDLSKSHIIYEQPLIAKSKGPCITPNKELFIKDVTWG